MYWFVLLCGWALTAAVIALVWMYSKPGRTFMAGLLIGLFAGVLWPVTLWLAIGAFLAGRRNAGAVPADIDAQLHQAEIYVRQAELEGMAGQAQYWRAEWDRLNALKRGGAPAVRPTPLVVLGCTVGALVTIGALTLTWPSYPQPVPTPTPAAARPTGAAPLPATAQRPTGTPVPTPTSTPPSTSGVPSTPASTPNGARRSGQVTIAVSGDGIDLDSPATDPQWTTGDDDLDYDGDYFRFYYYGQWLFLGDTEATYDTCRNTTGYSNGSSALDVGEVTAGDYLCVVTSDDRLATARIVEFGNSTAKFDVVVYENRRQ